VVVPAIVLFPSLFGHLVYDDWLLVARNPYLHSLARVPEGLTSNFWQFLEPRAFSPSGYWRPLTTFTLTLCWLAGNGRPFFFHFASLVLHLLATLVAWRFASRFAASERVGFWAALLFALHPVQVESVAWISAVSIPLYGVATFASLLAWLSWRERGSPGLPWGALSFAAVALFSKEMGAIVPLLAMAIDYGRARTHDSRWRDRLRPFLRGYVPFAVLLAVYYVVRATLVFHEPLAGFGRSTTDFGVGVARLLAMPVELLGGFLGLLLWPLELNLFRVFVPEIPWPTLALAGVLVLAYLLGIVATVRTKRRLEGTALSMIVLSLLPVLVLVTSLGSYPLADRHLYLAVFGFTLVLSVLVSRLPVKVAYVALATIALLYATRSHLRLSFWSDQETLFRAAAIESPKAPAVRTSLGQSLLQDYNRTRDPARLAEARAAFLEGRKLVSDADAGDRTIFATKEDHLQIEAGLAWCDLLAAARAGCGFDAVAERFERIIRDHPPSEEAWSGLALVRRFQHDLDGAEQAWDRALEINPHHVESRVNLARLELETGHDPRAALAHLNHAIDYDPKNPEAHELRGKVFLALGRKDEALADFEAAATLQPDRFESVYNEASLLARMRPREALPHLQRTLRLAEQLAPRDPRRRSIPALEGEIRRIQERRGQ